jgi:hypothetical protein
LGIDTRDFSGLGLVNYDFKLGMDMDKSVVGIRVGGGGGGDA